MHGTVKAAAANLNRESRISDKTIRFRLLLPKILMYALRYLRPSLPSVKMLQRIGKGANKKNPVREIGGLLRLRRRPENKKSAEKHGF